MADGDNEVGRNAPEPIRVLVVGEEQLFSPAMDSFLAGHPDVLVVLTTDAADEPEDGPQLHR